MNNDFYNEERLNRLQMLEEEIKTIKAMFNVLYYIHANMEEVYSECDCGTIVDLAIAATKPFAKCDIDYDALKSEITGKDDLVF